MERYYGSSTNYHLDELAYQFYNAGEWSKTYDYAQRAGQKAHDLYAPYSALEHLAHALEAAHHLEKPLPPSIYRSRALAYERLGEFDHAQADFESAIRIARTNQDHQQEWQSLRDLGAMWAGRDYNQTQKYYQSALNLARDMQEIPMIVSSLNRLGNWHMNVEEPLEALRYLIHDRGSNYGETFAHVAASSVITLLKTPYRAPKANAICERFMGSLRRECLNYILILSPAHLQRVVMEYTAYFNRARPHQSIDQRILESEAVPSIKTASAGRIIGSSVLA
jgi:tetratricopeptide (TPR) repeat protein